MGNLKSLSQEEFLLGLYKNVFEDLATMYPNHRSTLCRDYETLQSRVLAEGVSFLTKTLPSLGKAFDLALDTGSLTPHPSFKRAKGRRNPAFLRGLFSELFDELGNLVGSSPAVVKTIRQICYLVYKMEFPFSTLDERRAIQRFKENEESLDDQVLPSDVSSEQELLAQVLQDFDPVDILPRHGPGSVSTGEKLDKKWAFARLYSGIHRVYPYYDYFMVGRAELLDRVKWYRALQRLDVGIASVVLVPKDSRGPRIISKEPLEYQWIQQGLAKALTRHLSTNRFTRGRVNFHEQDTNKTLALESSRNRAYCTIDMKDASDLVSVKLVESLIPQELIKYFMAVRSHATTLPNGEVMTLKKYAPMGSAVCFPVEALIFWCISVVAVARHFGWTHSEVADNVYIYGDDIIVPTVCFDAVVQHLEAFGLVVNRQKCCVNGSFRESCGTDAFDGVDVTPLKMSTVWSSDPRSWGCLASYSAYANSLAERGYYAAAAYVRLQLRRSVGRLPYGTRRAGYPCISVDTLSDAVNSNEKAGFRVQWSTRFQTYRVRVRVLQPVTLSTTLDGWPRLLRHVCGQAGREPDRVTLPRSVQVRWAWRLLR